MEQDGNSQDIHAEREGIWCVVANVKGERPFGPDGVERRSGTRQFRAGTKVYIAGCYAGTCERVIGIGLHRQSRHFVTCVINVCHVENFQAKLVYQPRVMDIIRQDSRCFIRTLEEAEHWAGAFSEWQRMWRKPTMTEIEWLSCTDPTKLLSSLGGRSSDRRLRLFACACCRHVSRLFADARSQKAVEIAEQYADGLTDHDQLIRARDEARTAKGQFLPVSILPHSELAARRAANAAQDATRESGWSAASNCMAESARAVNPQDTNYCDPLELRHQTLILRCIFGYPFRPVALDPGWLAWNDRTVVKLAQGIYDDRAFDLLPILADALEDAGCHDPDMLAHCRQPELHVRGCWVVDLLLHKK